MYFVLLMAAVGLCPARQVGRQAGAPAAGHRGPCVAVPIRADADRVRTFTGRRPRGLRRLNANRPCLAPPLGVTSYHGAVLHRRSGANGVGRSGGVRSG